MALASLVSFQEQKQKQKQKSDYELAKARIFKQNTRKLIAARVIDC